MKKQSCMPLPSRCPECAGELYRSRFDATFRPLEGKDKLIFGVPGAYCRADGFLELDRELLDLLGLTDTARMSFRSHPVPVEPKDKAIAKTQSLSDIVPIMYSPT